MLSQIPMLGVFRIEARGSAELDQLFDKKAERWIASIIMVVLGISPTF
jgi:hypothetical protein